MFLKADKNHETNINRYMYDAGLTFPFIGSPCWGINHQMEINYDLGYLEPLIPMAMDLCRTDSCYSGFEGDDGFGIKNLSEKSENRITQDQLDIYVVWDNKGWM